MLVAVALNLEFRAPRRAVRRAANLASCSASARAEGMISGLGVSSGVYEGPARIVREPKELDRLVPGDVLVALVTSPASTRSFGSIGAVVTDRGGALSHAAITAREHGIPGVVGTRDASKRITDGMRIRGDGTRGEVRMLK